MKLIKEAKRLQQLAGIKEIKVALPSKLKDILSEYIKETEGQLENYDDEEQDEIQQFLSALDKNVSSIEDLAKKIKQIDDFITSEMSGAYEGEFYSDAVIYPLIKHIFPKVRPSETEIKGLLDVLDTLYYSKDGDEDMIGDSYQLYLDSK